MALAVAARPVGHFAPLAPPRDGPWDLAAMQTLEDTAAAWAFQPAEQVVNRQWEWVQQYWGGTVLPPMPDPQWHWQPWLVALLLVLGPRAVTAGMDAVTVIAWVRQQPPGVIPRQGPTGTPWSQRVRAALHPVVADVTARLEAWQQAVTETLHTVVTGAKRAVLTLTKLRDGIADHFTGWGQDLGRLVQTELSAARADAILETATEAWARVQTMPGACAVCRRSFDGKVFRIRKKAPEDVAAHAEDSLWPGKWTLNWDRKAADQWPAVPRHPRCRCRVIPIKEKKAEERTVHVHKTAD